MATIIDGSLAPRGKKISFPNGMEWYQSNVTSEAFQCIYHANNIWVAGSSDKGLYYSVDGKSWAQSNITSSTFYSVYNANGLWVAAGQAGLYYSTNGTYWVQSNLTSGKFLTVYNANGIWVAGNSSNNGLYYSVDGKTWTQSNITSNTFKSVYNANGMWVAGSSNGIYYSPTWEVSTPPHTVSEEWVFNETLTAATPPLHTDVTFTSNGTSFTNINRGGDAGGLEPNKSYYLFYNDTKVNIDSAYSGNWVNQAYRTITFTQPVQYEGNEEFVRWFVDNAVPLGGNQLPLE